MGTDNLFKKRREARKKRKYEYKRPKANSYLIVTEGERTEPLYLMGMRKLIEITEQIVKDAKIMYQNIWVVFDKDDFKDFDQAIKDGIEKGYKIAWSNQSFEYWLYLHFNYSDSALHRNEWNKKLDQIFKELNLGEGRYRKNYEDIYNIVNVDDRVDLAIKNAKRRMSGFDERRCKPSAYDPGTMVYKLVEELKKFIDE